MTAPTPRVLIGAVAIVSLAIVLAVGLLENRARRDVLDSVGWVSHTLQVQRDLVRTRMLLTDAETGQRGYLLTLDESYLDPNEQARAAVPAVMARLRRLTADNPRQQQRLSDLDRLATEKLAELRDTVVTAQRGNREAAMDVVIGGRGNTLMSEIRTLIQSALDEEERLLQGREAQMIRAIGRRTVLVRALITGTIAGLIVVAILGARLRRVRTLVTVCAWSKTVKYEGEWISYDEYLRRRFKVDITHTISPAEYAKLMDPVVGDDLHRI